MHRDKRTLFRKSQSGKHSKRKHKSNLKTKGAENITNWINLFLHLSPLILTLKFPSRKKKKVKEINSES